MNELIGPNVINPEGAWRDIDISVDTNSLRQATLALDLSDELINAIILQFTSPPTTPKQAVMNFFKPNKAEATVVGELANDTQISIFPQRIFRLLRSGKNPLIQTVWSDTYSPIQDQLANHALAEGIFLAKAYNELNTDESLVAENTMPLSEAYFIDTASSGYALGALAAARAPMHEQQAKSKLALETKRAQAQSAAKEFALKPRAVTHFDEIITIKY